uniref:Uncharacterized protein n=1 Tax=Candidatus Kentrum sp. LFY TaxID=2126342 RepID=A0A450WI57_9GAMM|nr:MAG: hypothetical protein BECKLFY1418C_GA0070996_102534 [Candidatus Kentron sp. LFY]
MKQILLLLFVAMSFLGKSALCNDAPCGKEDSPPCVCAPSIGSEYGEIHCVPFSEYQK